MSLGGLTGGGGEGGRGRARVNKMGYREQEGERKGEERGGGWKVYSIFCKLDSYYFFF